LVHLRYGEAGQPNAVWGGGHYEDTYVKTADGWRFKTRRFVPSQGTPDSLKPQAAASRCGEVMPRTSLALVLLLFVVVTARRAQTSADAADPALGTRDYLEIEQLVYEHGWALDSGENDGFAYADLYTADGTFTDTSQRPSGRTYQG